MIATTTANQEIFLLRKIFCILPQKYLVVSEKITIFVVEIKEQLKLTDMEINKQHQLALIKMKNDNDRIMYILEYVLGATSPETAAMMREIIDTGIAYGVTEPYPRTGDDGHPYWPRTSVMMGVGADVAVEANEEPYLHRGILTNVKGRPYGYWVDRTHKHEVQSKSEKSESIQAIMRKIAKRKVYDLEECVNPIILEKAKKTLNKRNIPFILETKKGHNILTVQIVNENFFSVPITEENADRTIGLMSYALHRPDMASQEIPGIVMFKNYVLESKWKELTKEYNS